MDHKARVTWVTRVSRVTMVTKETTVTTVTKVTRVTRLTWVSLHVGAAVAVAVSEVTVYRA